MTINPLLFKWSATVAGRSNVARSGQVFGEYTFCYRVIIGCHDRLRDRPPAAIESMASVNLTVLRPRLGRDGPH
ncbi:hypothetical protein J6590_063668 [Homalodisca vitripennis]|nr:hypothetical protein J6590_063668 [Homalodisca vitripennis]